MRVGSKSFFLASLLLPSWMRGPAIALYSFCRKADDDVDEGNVEGAKLRLQLLEKRLADAYDGNPNDNQVDRAFSAVVRAFEIPKSLLDAMLEGFRWDLDKVKYESYSDVIAYSARVAASVGGMMTILMGGKCGVTFARAFDLGAAMQLTNIARDVGEDARNGRVYLPSEWLREEGIDPKDLLREPRHSPGLARVIERLLQVRADMLYQRADHGISMLPLSCRVAIRAARLIYSEIGTKLKKNSFDSISRRTVVSKKKKILLAIRACAELVRPPRDICSEPVLPECEFLLKDILPLLKESNLTGGDVAC
ncbi:hypothetical protein GUITHDRAFT_94128 [Guillardia theta CCMP2712]|uniref:15-cis-phytoene synthase n=1 Tax=Guillardia theta (strain CCMP2712) TaxID=905079 RepID=L1JF06_GUITC|nr:hypothetical protein GUITHDRAFT_94128 [Guillardia theta CCMP2712]EKX46872.1 hypothetical protein GUITHDRAFT_94128 [Guillardia theta CCMP2712]|eukprot:XP_005833852.1 hypothetical protein GUITHDRAFT_94128 [Guillardia theta CCMP2712]